MPRLTPEERADLEARLAADDEDDESDQVTIGRNDGSSFTGSYKRAKQLGYVTEPAKETPKEGQGKTAEVKRFGGRRVS